MSTNLGKKVTHLNRQKAELPLGPLESREDCPCTECRRARRRAHRQKRYEPEFSLLHVWVVIIGGAVLVAVFGGTLFRVW